MNREISLKKINEKLGEFFELCRILQLSKEDILGILGIEERTYKRWALFDIRILSSFEITTLFMITEQLWDIYETKVVQSLQSKLGVILVYTFYSNNKDAVSDISLSYRDSYYPIITKEYEDNRETKPINQYGYPGTTGGYL